jgi:hypothetical protein
LLSNFSKDVDSDSALKVQISGEWSHFSFHMERTVFHYRIAESLILVPNIDQMYKEMKKFQTGNRSLINPFQLNAYQKASILQQSIVEVGNGDEFPDFVDLLIFLA